MKEKPTPISQETEQQEEYVVLVDAQASPEEDTLPNVQVPWMRAMLWGC
jgi:hypothetical protein